MSFFCYSGRGKLTRICQNPVKRTVPKSGPKWGADISSARGCGTSASTGESGGSALCSDLNPVRKPKSGPNQKSACKSCFSWPGVVLCVARRYPGLLILTGFRSEGRIFDRILANSAELAPGNPYGSSPPNAVEPSVWVELSKRVCRPYASILPPH